MKVLSRRSFIKKAIQFILLWAAVPASTYYYAREVEPRQLQINKHSIQSPTLPIAFNQFKVIHFSDTHIGFHYTLEQLRELVHKINAQRPQIICFTGDLIDNPDQFHQFQEVSSILSSLQATHGKFWVYGNHDHGGYGTSRVTETMKNADFTLLHNESMIISEGDSVIQIAGVDDGILGKPLVEEATHDIDPNTFTFMLAHEPDLADDIKHYPVDVQLSGHSHGGQIRFPIVGPFVKPRLAKKYVDGVHHFPKEQMDLYVSRGIGTTRLPFRFLCKPEINVYTLTSNQFVRHT